jgi:hypothetical protein
MIPRQFVITVTILFGLTIAMGVYVWQLRLREISSHRPLAKAEHVAPPTAGAVERVTLYVAHDDTGELRAESISIPLASERQQRAADILQALVNLYSAKGSTHPLSPDAEVRQVFLVDSETAVIDLNSAFIEGQVSGVLPEELTVTSLVESLAINVPGLTRVKILVDGKERETLAGHADLTGFYDVQLVAGVVKQLLPQ